MEQNENSDSGQSNGSWGQRREPVGHSLCLLVIDREDMSFEAVAGPSATAGLGAGIVRRFP